MQTKNKMIRNVFTLKKYQNLVVVLASIIMFGLLACYDTNKKNCFSKAVISENYKNNKIYFQQLIGYIRQSKLEPFEEIEFFENGDFSFTVHGGLANGEPSSIVGIEAWDDKLKSKIINIEQLPNNVTRISLIDTMVILNNWTWNFKGNSQTIGFKEILRILKLSDTKMDSLRYLTSKVNCKSIEIKNNGDVLLGFCGVGLCCKVQYIISTANNYEDMESSKLENEIYFKLIQDGRICKNCYLEK